MAEFQTVVKNFKRMCDSYKTCEGCPLKRSGTARSIGYCRHIVIEDFEEAERIIMQWAEEHPLVTNGTKFEEVFGHDVGIIWANNSETLRKWADAEYKGAQNGN